MIKKMDAKTDFSTFIRTELGGPSQLKPCSKGNSCFILISTTSGPSEWTQCFVSYFPSVVFSLSLKTKTIALLKCIPYTSSWFWHKPFINTCTDCCVKVIQSQPYKPYTHCHHRCFGGVIPMIASNGLSVCRKRNSLTRRRHRLQEGD